MRIMCRQLKPAKKFSGWARSSIVRIFEALYLVDAVPISDKERAFNLECGEGV